MRCLAASLAALLLAASPARAADDTPHGRVLVCYGMSYGVVELLYAAAENLERIAAGARKDEDGNLLRGLSEAGAKLQSRAVSLFQDMETCLRQAEPRAQPDTAATAVLAAMAAELDSASDAIDDFLDLFRKNKSDLDLAVVMEEDLNLIGFEKFPDAIKAALDRIEPVFVRVSDRSAR